MLSCADFDRLLLATVPDATLASFERLFDEAEALARRGLAGDPPPRKAWRAHLIRAWHHAQDMDAFMAALGSPKELAGVHDLAEVAPSTAVRHNLARRDAFWVEAGLHRVSPWYARWVSGLGDDDVCIGYLNPHLAASFYWRGLRPEGPADASSAHLASDHHLGHGASRIDPLEFVVNAVVHQLPREHFGVHHRPLTSWSSLRSTVGRDPVLSSADWVLRGALAVAPVLIGVERSGHATPWHRLDVSRW